MEKTKKVTKREHFTAIMNYLNENGKTELAKVMEHELDLLAKKNASGTGKQTATQKANEGLKAQIVECMATEPDRLFSASEMIKSFECCDGLSLPKVTALITQLVNEGKVARLEEKRKAYFRYNG